MPRKPKVLKQIRAERLDNHRCYDCGKKLWFYFLNRKTRCNHCFKLERLREKRRIRDRSVLGRMKCFFYYCAKEGNLNEIKKTN